MLLPAKVKWEYEGDYNKTINDMSSEEVSDYVPRARIITGCSKIDSDKELSSLISTMYQW